MINQKSIQKQISISDELKDILNGYIMGDGYLKPQGTLTVNQSDKQLKFVEWLHEKLKPICTEKSAITKVTRMRNNKETISYRFNTKAVLKDYYSNWYKEIENQSSTSGTTLFQKRLPTNIADLFTPIFITVWFACDGTKVIGSRGAKFEVTSLSAQERKVLKELFKSKFGISVNIIRSGKSSAGRDQWALCINSAEYYKFRDLITQIDLIEKLFPHKLHKKN